MKIRTNQALSFDDVLLAPKLGVISSRSEVDLRTKLTRNVDLGIPIVSSPMSTVTEWKMARGMAWHGGAGIIHRNLDPLDQAQQFQKIFLKDIGCAIGVNDGEIERFNLLMHAGCRVFCLDIAHGHSLKAAHFLGSIPDPVLDDVEFIVGSIATADAVEWYRDRFSIGAFRVGVGPGAACTTRTQTGFGVPQLTAIMECVEAADGIPVIADGGIKNSGDIVKALAAGASSVMLGRLLAGADEAAQPGKYYGMASYDAYQERGIEPTHIEGESGSVAQEGMLADILKKLLAGIKSGVSYGGATNIKELQERAEFIPVSHGASIETGVRI